MKRIYGLTAAVLLASLTIAPLALGQSTPAAQAARLKRLQDQQAAVLARVKAAQAASSAAAVPTTTPTVAPTTPPTPTAVPTVVKTATTPVPTPTASASAKPATSASAVPVTSASAAPAPVALALDIDALRKTRADRRHAEFTNLQARWGALLSDPRAAGELKLHAQRSAYLQRIRALADKAKDTAFVTSVDALITKEDSRDADAMNALRSGALPVGTAAAAPAAPAAGATK